ncbi:Stk1 family PASTA domain-containing Ser/Thr kinase [Candidatus Solirubrobacter pratensis]|uniref:Stk1 family PASTA domain-containing Ser/Thr kinase n=1 Tax=Candidatus Solirubrobacter pratensis TaxID=1298857 RepID=UPI0004061909|nr:PASTA domain-containing protein [Candidatus Solirubrobacter pratensis]
MSVQSIGRDTIVDGRYRVQSRLGSGGMAEVWSAADSQLGRRVALKLLASRFAADAAFRERFRREASAAAAMQHPNIVSIYDRGEWDGTSYIAMELVEGRTLKQLIQDHGPLAPGPATDLTIEILKALRYAHKRGIVHRDIKPQNVLIDAEGAVKVADFGIAHAGASDMTETGAIVGTVQYISPEQAQGKPVSPRSDLYSVGVVLYELLTGQVPFDGEAPVSIALKQVSQPPVPPSQLEPGIPPALEHVVLRALEKDPARRFADADEFIAALERARRAPPARQVVLEPTPGEPWAPVDEEDRGSRWWVWLLALLVLAALAAGAYYLFAAKRVDVPSVVGKTTSEAADTLHRRGLEVNFVNEVSKHKRGEVISQDPKAGSRAKEGSTVTAHVSAGPGTAPVPQVEGLSQADAEKAVKDAGLNPKVKRTYSDSVAKGKVISSSPGEGEEITKGRTVTLTVSRGPQGVTVPNLVGLSRDDAAAQLSDLGLTPSVTEKESAKDPGTVLSQDPAVGATLDKGASVSLVVAQERPGVPDVTTDNPSQADAEQRLKDAGYKVQVREDPNAPPELAGRVTGQDPAAGERRSTGATVTITVGGAPAAAGPTPSPTPSATP